MPLQKLLLLWYNGLTMEAALTSREIEIVCHCIKAAAYGPFLIDERADNPFWEIHTLLGVTMERLRQIADQCPTIDLRNAETRTAVHNVLNNLLYYPYPDCQRTWESFIRASPEEVKFILSRV